jgi:hypothetical protein
MRVQCLLGLSLIVLASCGGGGGGPANQAPTVVISADTTAGTAPLRVQFIAAASDPDGDPLTFRWDTNGDGTTDVATGAVNSLTQQFTASTTVAVQVEDARGATASASLALSVNALPQAVTALSNAFPGGLVRIGNNAAPALVAGQLSGQQLDNVFLQSNDPLGTSWAQTSVIPFTGLVEVETALDRLGSPVVLGTAQAGSNVVFARNSATDGSGTWTVTDVTAPAAGAASNVVATTLGELPIVFCTLRVGNDVQLVYLVSFNNGADWSGPHLVDEITGNIAVGGALQVQDGVSVAYVKSSVNPGPPETFEHTLVVANITGPADLPFALTTVATTNETISHFARLGNGSKLSIVTLGPDSNNGILGFHDMRLYVSADGGQNWDAPITVMQDDLHLRSAVMTHHDAFPALVLTAALEQGGFELHSLHALDTEGQRWSAPVRLDALPNGFVFKPSGVAALEAGLGIAYGVQSGNQFTTNFLLLPSNDRQQ